MKILSLIFVLLFLVPMVFAFEFDDISESDKATFNEILEPVMRIYNLIKYTATVIACIMGVLAGISYITSSNDPKKRDNAKHMITYILIGLAIIWAAPLVVNFVLG